MSAQPTEKFQIYLRNHEILLKFQKENKESAGDGETLILLF